MIKSLIEMFDDEPGVRDDAYSYAFDEIDHHLGGKAAKAFESGIDGDDGYYFIDRRTSVNELWQEILDAAKNDTEEDDSL